MEIDGVSYDVWADTKYNLSDIDDKFGGLMSVVRFAAALLVYLALIRYLVNTYHRIFGGVNSMLTLIQKLHTCALSR